MNLNEQIIRIKTIMGLNENETFTNHMQSGKDSNEIEMLQNVLKINETGEFDKTTEYCVKQFQEFTKIKIDGIVGPETRGKLNDFLLGKINDWKGCNTTEVKKSEEETNSEKESNDEPKDKKIVGSSWKSCKAWFGSGGLSKWKDYVDIQKSNSRFVISYTGPVSGLSIAHAFGGKDTIHQLFNILICELNPFLGNGGLIPDIQNITFNTSVVDGKNKLEINVPINSIDGTYQIDRRGGWGHDPGSSKMSRKCQKKNKNGEKCIGPVTKVAQGSFGKITEYFITYEI